MLDSAHRSNPNTHWWLKGDGCDLVAGLGESMRLQWSGDVDIDSGDLQQAYESYCSVLQFVDGMQIGENCINNLRKCSSIMVKDKEFLVTGVCIC